VPLLLALSLAFLTTAHCFCMQNTYSSPYIATNWVQLGEILPSDNNAPVGFSPDGLRLHVGSNVYTWSHSQWKLLRGQVDGESYESGNTYYYPYTGEYYDSSSSMFMSGDSSHVAFGTDNKVRVYEWKSDAWTRKGYELVGANGFGSSISLSKDGARLAIGSPSHPSDNCTKGAVSVYEWKVGSNSWLQMGESMFCYNKTDDQVGKAISLSGDGSRVAIGAPGFDGPDECYDYYMQGMQCYSTKPDMGQVRVYEWDPSSGTWLNLVFATWEGNLESINGDSGHQFGVSVALSGDGNRLIVGNDEKGNGQSEVRAYHWMEPTTGADYSGNPVNFGDAWIRVGHCEFKVSGYAAASVSISDDGNSIAISASNYQSSSVSAVNTLRWERGEWEFDGVYGMNMPQYTGKFTAFGIQGYEMEMGGGGLKDPACPTNYNSNCYTSFGSSFSIAGDDMSTRLAVRASTGVYVFHVTYCDASAPPENGGTGTCTGKLAPEQNCWTNCSAGFISTGPSECNAQGKLAPGMCLVTSTIEGEQGFGNSVVVSDDGNTVAVLNAPGPGHVKVYGYSQESGHWAQVGDDILSNDEDGQERECMDGCIGYPQAVSLSSDGTRLAVGYPGKYDGRVSYSFGRARVFERRSDSWIQIGGDIIGGQGNSSAPSYCDDMGGNDCSWWYKDYMVGLGYSVSLSADGSRLAVGSKGNRYGTYEYSNGYSSTQYTTFRLVRVYQEPDSGASHWSKFGNTLDAAAGGSIYVNNYGGSTDTEYGSSVSLSDDGSTVAIAGWKGLHASVHRFDPGQNIWLQVGNNITFNLRWYDGPGYGGWYSDPIGKSIALAGDSKRVIVGRNADMYSNAAPGFAGVFELDPITGNWTLMGDVIEGVQEQSGSAFGYSVAISHDGTRIAVGDPSATSPNAGTNGDDKGATRVYEWISGSWRSAIGTMYGSQARSGASISLSGDGTRLVVGEQYYTSNMVTIRDLPVTLINPNPEETEIAPAANTTNTTNTSDVSPPAANITNPHKPPPPPPPPPMSLEELVSAAEGKTEQAEASRDSLLADIGDEKTKAKAKLLADAAIAGVKVTKIAMALKAESDDAACTQAFSKMQLDASLGACDVAVSASRRRRLVAETSYDVNVYLSPATVDTATLISALENLAAESITATSTETDPTEELRAIPGIDATSLESFAADAAEAAEATAAATEAETTWVPPPPMPPFPEPPVSPPPTSPPPPPNRLIFGGDYESSASRYSVVTALVVSIVNLYITTKSR
jgi:hypothetical protein